MPAVARDGHNVVRASARMPWHPGPTVLEWLESVEVAPPHAAPLRFLVQGVNRPDGGLRGYAGYVASGAVDPGDAISTARRRPQTRIARIVTIHRARARAQTG